MIAIWLILFAILQITQALPPYNYADFAQQPGFTNASIDYTAELPLKFQKWFPQLGYILNEASTGPCNLSLSAYMGNHTSRLELGGVGAYCNLQNDCILSTIYQSTMVNMAAASVLLGLTPTILSAVGPGIAEIALLSSRRPFLSLLLAMGAPATFPSRFLLYDDPVKLLRRGERSSVLKITRVPVRWSVVIVLCQYVFAVLAIVNLIITSLDLGERTVVSWKCPVSWLPLVWTMTPIAIHAPAVLSFELYRRKFKRVLQTPELPDQDSYMLRGSEVSDQDSYMLGDVNRPEQNTHSYYQTPPGYSLIRALKSEVTLSANVDSVPMAKAESI